jgi:hypothetical protein
MQKRDLIRANGDGQPMFVTWHDEKSKQKVFNAASREYGVIAQRDSTHGSSMFSNVGNGVSVRDGFSRQDWEYFRPEESIPREMRNIFASTMMAYKRIGIVKRIIDLMGEFTCQGIRLVHPQPQIEMPCTISGHVALAYKTALNVFLTIYIVYAML